ncbi:MAG: GntR family transcriptional regulator [Gluconacetobacter diazotrophicus]|nr:GntR family transcriptional regulator [Gluconacetobacter diazotrophicus]
MDASPADVRTTAPAARPLLRDEAYSRIRHHLFTVEQLETAPLSERGLAAALELGLGPVRSALERLRAEGLIAVSPNNGIHLPDLSPAAIIDFYEIRLVMECHVASRLAGRLTREQDVRLERIIVEQEDAARRGDTDSYHRLDLDLHATLVAFHGNAEMVQALNRLRDKMYRLSRRLHRSHPERLLVNAAQHRGIVEALRDGDGARARARMETHLDWGRRFTLDPDGRLGPPPAAAEPEPDHEDGRRKKRRDRGR